MHAHALFYCGKADGQSRRQNFFSEGFSRSSTSGVRLSTVHSAAAGVQEECGRTGRMGTARHAIFQNRNSTSGVRTVCADRVAQYRRDSTFELTWIPNFGFASFFEALSSTDALPTTFGLTS